MPKPIHVVTDYRTHRREMRDTLEAAMPKSNPTLGLMLGFASTIALVYAVASWLFGYLAGGG